MVEVIGGFLTNSLALISDAGHMLTHLFALLVSLFALFFAAKPPTEKKTYGFYRLEILAALFNGIMLFMIILATLTLTAEFQHVHQKSVLSLFILL